MPVRALCLILDAMVLASGDYPVHPEAVALAGAAHHLQAELEREGGATLTLAAVRDERSAAAVAALQGIAEREVLPLNVEPGASVGLADCPGGAEMAILAARDGKRPLGPGTLRWQLGDQYYGLAETREAGRRLREELGQPVPRTRNPETITGGLVLLPAGTPDETLLRAIYEQPGASWLTLGERAVFYTENGDQEDRLAALPGATRLSYAVHRHRMRVVEGGAPPGAELLHREGGQALVVIPDATDPPGTAWEDVRFRTVR
jgi:hypothetical protein